MTQPGIHEPDLLEASLHGLSSGDEIALRERIRAARGSGARRLATGGAY